MTDHFDFSHALSLLKQGKRVARKGWEEWAENSWVELKPGSDGLIRMTMCGPSPTFHGTDLIAEDWHEVTA